MKAEHNDRREFLKAFGALSLAGGITPAFSGTLSPEPDATDRAPDLVSLSPLQVFDVLDLDRPGLEKVRAALQNSGRDAALAELLAYYRKKYPAPAALEPETAENGKKVLARADRLEIPEFQWGPYPAAAYPSPIDWAYDPAKDIEWVASVYRFSWAGVLVKAYQLTGDPRYVRTFVRLTSDWIGKHQLEKSMSAVHPVYTYWKGYAWLDLQTGIRATNISLAFRSFVHSEAFTADFLGVLLASMYDHQHKTELLPMNNVHNKAVFEQRGFVNVVYTFPEFRDRDRWLDMALERTTENMLAQTTTDGVQKEWCGGYHLGVYRDILEIEERYRSMGRKVSPKYMERLKAMADHIFWLATPELSFPMFGDTSRHLPSSPDRKTWALYPILTEASRRFNEPRFSALADLKTAGLPANGSRSFAEAGLFVLRKGWDTRQIYMALHCSPPGISTHDTADNGTFELYAYGRWLMPDSGFYLYGRNNPERDWHRQTKVHSTLTVNGKDTEQIGRQLSWVSGADQDVLCVENNSYRYFTHRRTVWLAGKTSAQPFFVIVDEAIGDLKGDIEVHFPMAPGTLTVDEAKRRIVTGFDDANLLIEVAGKKALTFRQTEGWTSPTYGKREKRPAVSVVQTGQAPTVFVSVLVPYKGRTAPDVLLETDPGTIMAGDREIKIGVKVGGKAHTLTRRL